MANFERSRRVLKAYDRHVVTEREALEMVNLPEGIQSGTRRGRSRKHYPS